MLRRLRSDPLDPAEMTDNDLRKKIFREYGRDLSGAIKEKVITDRPGEIARLMERAYQAGLAVASLTLSQGPSRSSPPSFTDHGTRDLEEIDVPAFSIGTLSILRYAVLGPYPTKGRIKNDQALVVIFMPPDPLNHRSPKTGQWFIGSGNLNEDPISGRAMAFFVKAGFYDTADISKGWRIGFLNEWGLEFLAIGRTSHERSRPGTRSSLSERLNVIERRPLLDQVCRKFGLIA